MATKIVTKNSSTGGSAPSASDLVQGELAVNVTDKRLYTENASGAIVELGTNPSTIDINAGTVDGITSLSTSTSGTSNFIATCSGFLLVISTIIARFSYRRRFNSVFFLFFLFFVCNFLIYISIRYRI